MPHYSVIVPVHSEAESLPELSARIEAVFTAMGALGELELLFVDDGSTDETPEVLARLADSHPFIRFLRLRRNCGKSLALMAGFRAASGKVVVTMDGDLQDNPEDIPSLLAKLEEGYDLVNGWRLRRQDQTVRKLGSRVYNATIRRLTGLELQDQNCGMKAYRRQVLNTLVVSANTTATPPFRPIWRASR